MHNAFGIGQVVPRERLLDTLSLKATLLVQDLVHSYSSQIPRKTHRKGANTTHSVNGVAINDQTASFDSLHTSCPSDRISAALKPASLIFLDPFDHWKYNSLQINHLFKRMCSPLTLTHLPPELIARIADNAALSKHDLTRLRLTCKLFNIWATQSLAKQHLSKIGITLTRVDLQALSEICKHPQFGPCIRSVQLDHTRVHPSHIAVLADDLIQAKQSRDVDRYPQAKERLQGFTTRFVDELELEDSEEALRSLIVAFTALKSYDSHITLTSADLYHMGCPFNHERITKSLRPYIQDEPKFTHLNSTMRVLFQAASRSDLHVNCFQFSYWDPQEWQASIQSAPYIDDKICSELETLKFEFVSPLDEAKMLPLKQFLATVTNVKNLELNLLAEPDTKYCVSIREIYFCQEILESIVPNSLSSIELWNVGVSQKSLSVFLSKHRNILHSLTIAGSALFEGSWLRMFAWIRDQLFHLQAFTASQLWEMQEEDENGNVATEELFANDRDWKFVVKGNNTHVGDGITKLLRKASRK